MPTIRDIAVSLGREDRLRLLGAFADAPIERAVRLDDATSGSVSFCGHTMRDPASALARARPSLLIVDEGLAVDEAALRRAGVQALLETPNARLDFIRVVARFFAPPRPKGVHASAVISASARIAASAYVGPLCSIGDEVAIGDDSVIHSGVQIYPRVSIGRRVTVHSGTVIGADGFGYEKNERGELERFPHLGGVVIEDDVDIGANTCVDRGALGDTHIRRGARIDNLVHIAHNVQVGAHAAVIADAMIGGSVRIGDYAWIAPSACIRDRVSVGERAVVGLASLVTKDVPADVTVLGAPARLYSKGASRS